MYFIENLIMKFRVLFIWIYFISFNIFIFFYEDKRSDSQMHYLNFE